MGKIVFVFGGQEGMALRKAFLEVIATMRDFEVNGRFQQWTSPRFRPISRPTSKEKI